MTRGLGWGARLGGARYDAAPDPRWSCAMYITDLTLRDLRSFGGEHHISLDRGDGRYAGWTVLVGRNGAGKSTLLRAIALAVIGPDAARGLVGVFKGWVRQGCAEATVGVGLTVDHDYDMPSNVGDARPRALAMGLRWTRRIGSNHMEDRTESLEAHYYGERQDEPAPVSPYGAPWTHISSGWFVAGYGPYRHLGPPSADLVRLSESMVYARLVNLFYEGSTFSDAVDWLKLLHARALEGRPRAAVMRDDVLRVLRDGLLPDNSEIDRVDSEGLWIKRDGVCVPLEQVSDGYRTVAALVVDLLRRLFENYDWLELERHPEGHLVCPIPGVVLIDEVEAHLHVAWQQRLGFWLTRCFPNIQFLVTTHSPFVCQAASPRGIIRLPAPGEDDTLRHVSDEVWREATNGGADDTVLTELFGLEHAHSLPAELRRQEVARLEAKLLRGQGTEADRARYDVLSQSLGANLGELADRRLRALVSEDR